MAESEDSPPEITVETPVAERLQQVIGKDGLAQRKIGNGPCHLQDAVVAPGTEVARSVGAKLDQVFTVLEGTNRKIKVE